jgi:hypothetical protein
VAKKCAAEQAHRTWNIMYYVTLSIEPDSCSIAVTPYQLEQNEFGPPMDQLNDRLSRESDGNCSDIYRMHEESRENLFQSEG